MKTRIWVGISLLLIAALACGSGTSGSAVGGNESCNRSGNSGSCTGTYSTISGTYTKNVKVDRLHVNDAVQVVVTASVTGGTLKVSVKQPDGLISSAEATPGQPLNFSGTAIGALDQFPVTFEAVGGDATGVQYTINYQVP